ncbi:hypothetical protein HDN1F_01120 [gamma proteobacterium HdN1]|nr:hypothetical protein HDN1F_01120 [gamma proteobacterium HdN1]
MWHKVWKDVNGRFHPKISCRTEASCRTIGHRKHSSRPCKSKAGSALLRVGEKNDKRRADRISFAVLLFARTLYGHNPVLASLKRMKNLIQKIKSVRKPKTTMVEGVAPRLQNHSQSLLRSEVITPSVTMVLGMHRSGTSFLTGSLQEAGLELGKHSAWNPHNLKGNRENEDIVALHDDILARNGSAWDQPPSTEISWQEHELARARAIALSYDGVPHWGFKDPRVLLLVEGWQSVLENLGFVGIFRHPVAVAQSLNARGGMPQSQAFALWLAYNQRLLALYQKQPFPVLCFDENEDVLLNKLDLVLRKIGLEVPKQERFFSSELKHHSATDITLPEPLMSTYNALCVIAI